MSQDCRASDNGGLDNCALDGGASVAVSRAADPQTAALRSSDEGAPDRRTLDGGAWQSGAFAPWAAVSRAADIRTAALRTTALRIAAP